LLADVAALLAEVEADDADVAAEVAEVNALDALVAAEFADVCVLVCNEDNEIHVPVLVSVSAIDPISLTRPDAT